MDPDAAYADLPLASGQAETRLLRIERSQDSYGPVECTLFKTNLADQVEYEALSYCWGDKTDLKMIIVNGQGFLVTANLANALRRLRRTAASRSNQPRVLWVDALCINQQDVAERSSQVAMMHEIYMKAVRTIAWLGEDENDGGFALEFLQWYAGRKVLLEPHLVDGSDPAYEARGWAAVVSLMQRPYWRRLWVMQEIALSSSYPRVICGRSGIQWKNLITALAHEQSAFYITRLDRVRGATKRLMDRIAQGTASERKESQNGRHIIFLLSHSAGFETTEPRDRVYALYGLFRVAGIVDFQPDYSIPIAEVYRQITEFAIQMKGGLDVLELRSHLQDESLPSWVLDLKQASPPSFPVKHAAWHREETDLSEELERLSIRPKFKTLQVSGAIVDEISTLYNVGPCLAIALQRAAEDPNARLFGGDSLRSSNIAARDFWESKSAPSPKHSTLLCQEVMSFFQAVQNIIGLFCEANIASLDWFPQPYDWRQMASEALACSSITDDGFDERYLYRLKPILCTLSLMLHGRSCFVTKEGFLGAALAGIHSGDKVVAFQSTKNLHVLRPLEDGGHRYVGAAVLVPSEEKGMVGLSDRFSRKKRMKASDPLSAAMHRIRDGEIEEHMFSIR